MSGGCWIQMCTVTSPLDAQNKNTPHVLDDTDCDQPGAVVGLVLLEALCCSVNQSIHRADPQPVNCDP